MLLPLITFTPRYHEVEWEHRKLRHIELYVDQEPIMKQFISVEIKVGFKLNKHLPPQPFYVSVIIDNSQNKSVKEIETSFLDSWYIVYACIGHDVLNDEYKVIHFIDSFGSIHRAEFRVTGYTLRTYVSNVFIKQLPILPDSFIDSIIEKFTLSTEHRSRVDGTLSIRTFPKESMIPLKTPEQPTLPHRKFELTTDLFDYIQKLEVCVKQKTQDDNTYRGNNVFLTSVPPMMLEAAKPKNE